MRSGAWGEAGTWNATQRSQHPLWLTTSLASSVMGGSWNMKHCWEMKNGGKIGIKKENIGLAHSPLTTIFQHPSYLSSCSQSHRQNPKWIQHFDAEIWWMGHVLNDPRWASSSTEAYKFFIILQLPAAGLLERKKENKKMDWWFWMRPCVKIVDNGIKINCVNIV